MKTNYENMMSSEIELKTRIKKRIVDIIRLSIPIGGVLFALSFWIEFPEGLLINLEILVIEISAGVVISLIVYELGTDSQRKVSKTLKKLEDLTKEIKEFTEEQQQEKKKKQSQIVTLMTCYQESLGELLATVEVFSSSHNKLGGEAETSTKLLNDTLKRLSIEIRVFENSLEVFHSHIEQTPAFIAKKLIDNIRLVIKKYEEKAILDETWTIVKLTLNDLQKWIESQKNEKNSIYNDD